MRTFGTDGSKMTSLFGNRKIKMPNILKIRSSSSASSTNSPAVELDSPPAVLTFEENLKQRNLLAACQQLIALEDRLFGENSCALPAEREQLETQHEVLLNQVWLVVEASLNSGEEDLEILEEVAKVIQLEEERDKQWQKAKESGTGPVPDWRPFNCRSTHDDLLSKMVKKRLDDTENLSGGDNLSSSLKKDIFKMGKCLKDDMKKVVRDVKRRYPEEFDICNLYARLYHQTFSARLLAITEFGLDLQDLIYVLYWVHSLYPNDVLQSTELKDDINSEHLGCLLPADVLRPLEDQYLSHKEGILNTWTSNALKNEEDSCLKGNLPDVFDGCYFTNIAIDVVEIFDEAAKEARSVLGDLNKAKSIAGQLNIFLASYKSFLEAVLKGRYGNILPTVKAHLASLETFRGYIMNNADLFTDDVRAGCLSTVAELKCLCHSYITSSVHKDLKPAYSKLGTGTWFSGAPVGVLEGLQKNIENIKTALNKGCCEELLGQLHKEVLAEYVSRLMKRNLKLADEDQQRTAATLVSEDNERLHALFTEAGSKEEWLRDVLSKISEVLRIQDVGFIQLEVATLVRDFPDISSLHIKALLSLKRNLSSDDIYRIKHGVKVNRSAVDSSSSRSFFSMVSVKQKFNL
ncbi:tumor necrosis factor alpha-induced protein 2-like isoform X1 [Scleropages formosus]|uniref:Tumor necrosis factor, alpha-induced protein 2b n=1 Tax=Scleropages formosus TaxID=113540 RepID=A0A8C9VEM1_SCLFO|nr:tumor necrosis factor alpha-induced protein 2-like isoform X1 [Scleropages formosus]